MEQVDADSARHAMLAVFWSQTTTPAQPKQRAERTAYLSKHKRLGCCQVLLFICLIPPLYRARDCLSAASLTCPCQSSRLRLSRPPTSRLHLVGCNDLEVSWGARACGVLGRLPPSRLRGLTREPLRVLFITLYPWNNLR